jgi:hypothetical protein
MSGAGGDLWATESDGSVPRELSALQTTLRALAIQPGAREFLGAFLDMPIGAPAYASCPDMLLRPTGTSELSASNQTIGYLLLKVLLSPYSSKLRSPPQGLCDLARRTADKCFRKTAAGYGLIDSPRYYRVWVHAGLNLEQADSLLPNWCTRIWPGIETIRDRDQLHEKIASFQVASGSFKLDQEQTNRLLRYFDLNSEATYMHDGVVRNLGMQRMRSAGQLFLVGNSEVSSRFEMASSEDAARRNLHDDDSDEELAVRAVEGTAGGKEFQRLLEGQQRMLDQLKLIAKTSWEDKDDDDDDEDNAKGEKEKDSDKEEKRKKTKRTRADDGMVAVEQASKKPKRK